MTTENTLFFKKENRSNGSTQRSSYGALSEEEQRIIHQGLDILTARFQREAHFLFTEPQAVRNYLRLHLTAKEQEVFACLYLDNQHQLIAYRELFFGTINSCSVYEREVVKQAVYYNAAAVIFAHNHPSGVANPSLADKMKTRRLKQVLDILDVQVLDHMIVGVSQISSFAESGLI